MSTCLFALKAVWLLRFFLLSAFILVLSLLLLKPAHAFNNPHLYYDWNTYYENNNQVLGIRVFAQEATDAATPAPTQPVLDYHDYKEFDGYVLGFTADLNPDDPLYFLKRLQENVAVTFTFDANVREETRIELAGERLSEMEAMADEGKADLVASLAETYNSTVEAISDNLSALKDQGQDVTPLLVATDLEAAKHTLVLEEVSLKVPSEAEAGIKTALAASEKAVDTVADLAGRPAVPQELIVRLQSLRAQGFLTAEEVASLTDATSRVAAREELRKLADARVLPGADFKKLDEAARSYFPQGYMNVIEYKKFRELKSLETQRPDATTLAQLQTFADAYTPGDAVPPQLRQWWAPMVRLEELQNTIRPDLISENFFRYRPDDQQKYKELVERVKPRAEDIAYVNRLTQSNPGLLSDPAYARIKALADKFGMVEAGTGPTPGPLAQSCSRDSHWVNIPFMPNGGYCVPNLVYAPITGGPGLGLGTETPCPPGYHRNEPGSACYPDNPFGPGGGTTGGGFLPAPGSCFSGYHWVAEPGNPRGGYCAPDYPTTGGGPFPGPIAIPTYCPSGQMFRDGKCERYSPPPAEGCPQGQYWTGQSCVIYKQCPAGQYQGSNGECVTSTRDGGYCQAPPAGCGFGAHWDSFACSCISDTLPVTYSSPGSCAPPGGGCGNGVWDSYSCTCRSSTTYASPAGSCTPPPSGCPSGWTWVASACSCNLNPGTNPPPGSCNPPTGGCPSGWYWNAGACSCNLSSGGGTYGTPTYGTPSGGPYPTYPPGYGTPSYGTPSGGGGSCGPGYYWTGSYCAISGGGTYGTPYYGTPSGTYGTPYYGTPSGTYGSPTYGSPSYGSPTYGSPTYGTPEYSSPPPYGTPEYSSPAPYGTPSYGTPQ